MPSLVVIGTTNKGETGGGGGQLFNNKILTH